VQVSVILDPVSEAAQRFTPLLKVIRDKLKLPLQLLLAPAVVLEGDDKIPITSYYRFVGDPTAFTDDQSTVATFSNLPTNHILTLQVDVPEPWNVQQSSAIQDTDNLRCDIRVGCSDDDALIKENNSVQVYERGHFTNVEYGLKNLLIFGQCYELANGSPPNGLQLTVSRSSIRYDQPLLPEIVEIGLDGESIPNMAKMRNGTVGTIYSDTLVMKNVGYWQLPANPGVWKLGIDKGSEGAKIFEIISGSIKNGALIVPDVVTSQKTKTIVMQDFVSRGEVLLVQRRPGYENADLFFGSDGQMINSHVDDDIIHVFSLATGHLYERFLKIMMLSVTKRTSSKVKFWLFENFLSPTFKASALAMATRIGCEVEFVTYKWPEWLRGQSEKQRIIWGYKVCVKAQKLRCQANFMLTNSVVLLIVGYQL
jgi:UDP-glucose:glycoprotein glucosyltransferase